MVLSRSLVPRLTRLLLVVVVGLAVAGPAAGQEKATKPPLSKALREALEKEPPATVQKRFEEGIQAGEMDFEFDVPQLNALGMEYMQAGETEKSIVVMGIMALAATSMATQMLSPEMVEAMEAQEKANEEARRRDAEGRDERVAAAQARRRAEAAEARERAIAALGPGRDDLERFHGLYAVPGRDNWSFFLVRNCDGHLTMGAMWADVMPWVMRSLGDTTFEYPGGGSTDPIRVEITAGPDGKAISIRHDLDDIATPNPRTGDLPEGWATRCDGGS